MNGYHRYMDTQTNHHDNNDDMPARKKNYVLSLYCVGVYQDQAQWNKSSPPAPSLFISHLVCNTAQLLQNKKRNKLCVCAIIIKKNMLQQSEGIGWAGWFLSFAFLTRCNSPFERMHKAQARMFFFEWCCMLIMSLPFCASHSNLKKREFSPKNKAREWTSEVLVGFIVQIQFCRLLFLFLEKFQ